MPDRPKKTLEWRKHWGLILAMLAALAVFGIVIAYEYTGDFTGLMTIGTRGRHFAE